MEKDNIIWIVKNLQILTVGGRELKEKITILIADDNIDFTRTLSAHLENMDDIEVVGVAKDGNEAFEIIKGTHPDILLLDVIMPHLDGIGVLEKLNETPMTKKPISIMLSAVGQDYSTGDIAGCSILCCKTIWYRLINEENTRSKILPTLSK